MNFRTPGSLTVPRHAALAALLLSALHAAALAQDCDGRPATEAERQYFRTVQQAAETLLPPPPAGWQVVGGQAPAIRLLEPDALSCEDPSAAIGNRFGRDYSRYSGEQWFALDAAHREARAQRPESPAARQLRALRAEGDAQLAAVGTAAGRQDFAALERLQERIEDIGRQASLVEAQVQREDRVYDHFQPDSFIHLTVSVNGGASFESVQCFGAAKKLVVKGATTAIQCLLRPEQREGDDSTLENATALIGFGQVDAAAVDAEREPARAWIADRARQTGPYTAIRALTVRINAAPATLDAFIAGTDWSRFAQTVAR